MSRKKNHGGHEEAHADERWLITYADMVTLLLAVFIVLYALSDTNVRKFTAFAQSVSAAFTTDIFEGTSTYTITSGDEIAPGEGDFDSGSGVMATDYRTIEATIRDFAIEEGLDDQVDISQVPEGIAIRINSRILFQSGRSRLDVTSVGVLDEIAAIISPLPNALRVEGHTDDQAPDGIFFRDNWQLSTARALAVLDRLRDDGITAARLSAAGYGEFRPLVENTSDDNRSVNRRVEILVLYPQRNAATGDPGDGAGPVPTFAIPIGGHP